MEVGRQVRRIREEKGWSQAKLAGAAGMGVSGISQIETGARNPSAVTLAKIAGALDVEVADLFPKAQAPLWSDESPEERRARLEEWLKEHNARRILMSDGEVVKHFERMASGSDGQAITNRLEQDVRNTFREEAEVDRDLAAEFAGGGELLPRVEDGPDLVKRAFARHKEYTQLKREIRRRYGRYYRALESYSKALFFEGWAADFVMVNRRPQTVEAMKAAIRALQVETFEDARGA
jgi:transcriptional regulator with XRE-family HTH domain